MDKAIVFTPEVATIMMYSAARIAVVCTFVYAAAVIVINQLEVGKHICMGVSSLFSKIRRRIHG